MKYSMLAVLLIFSIACSQYTLHDYTMAHVPNPPLENVTNYIYFYWQGNDFNSCPLREDMTLAEVLAIPQSPLDITMTWTDTLIYGILDLEENGMWHTVGAIAENAEGQTSLLALAPFMVKPRILTNLTKIRSLIIERNP